MSDENNMFGNDNQQGDSSLPPEMNRQDNDNQQSGENVQQAYSGQQDYSGQQGYNDQQAYSGQQGYNDQQAYNDQQSYNSQQDYNGQQAYSGQQGYNGQQQGGSNPYGEQYQQTPLSGYAEPVYHNQYNSNNEESQGFGIASLICGILAIITCCCWCPCAPLAIVSIVLGILQISKGAGSGKGMAIAGIICSAVGLVLMIVCIMFTVVMNSSGLSENYYRNYYDILEQLEDMDYTEHGHHSYDI